MGVTTGFGGKVATGVGIGLGTLGTGGRVSTSLGVSTGSGGKVATGVGTGFGVSTGLGGKVATGFCMVAA